MKKDLFRKILDRELILSQNGDFVYRLGKDFYTCILSPVEERLILIIKDQGQDREIGTNTLLAALWPNHKGRPSRLKSLVERINKRLEESGIPATLVFDGHLTRIQEDYLD